jgi:DNA polymerase-4
MALPPVQIRKIIHVDMDAFFASVEQRDNPDLRGKPVGVGGSPSQRGVIAAASYEARQFGVHSAMPSRTAVQRCPHLVLVRPRFDVYRDVSEQIREIFFRYTDLVEPLSLDEAYLDVTENKRGMPSATLIAREIKESIQKETNLTASAGISINKFLAKTASGINKPDGLTLIPPEKAEAFIEKLAIEDFYGIGKVTAQKMHSYGIYSGADLKKLSEAELIKKFGKTGSYYFRIVRAIDDRPVEPNRIPKSIGAEESFAEDLADRYSMVAALEALAQTVERRLDKSGTGGRTVTLKVKYGDYQQVTRSKTMTESIKSAHDIMKVVQTLMTSTEIEQRNVRLLGVQVSSLDCDREEQDYVQLTIEFA